MIEETLVILAAPILAGGMHPNVAPQGCSRPYGVYTEIVSPTENTLSDGVPIQQSVLQIDIWDLTYAGAKAAGEALVAALAAESAKVLGFWPDADPSLGLDFTAATYQVAAPDAVSCIQRSRRSRFDGDAKLHGFTYEFSFWYH